MSRTMPSAILGGLVTTLIAVQFGVAQPADRPTPAPVPAQLRTAKKVFISNLGADAMSTPLFIREGDVDKPYNHFYAAMKAWGHYTLVGNPDEADQVFEIRFSATITSTEKIDTYAPQLELTIVDAKTRFTLWTLAEPVKGAFFKSTWDKNFGQGISDLVEDLKRLTAPTSADQQAANK